jgi:hypothetical protein
MYELLLRTETLFLGLQPLVLLGIGVVTLGVGLVLWLGGSRHSAVITGVFGALVGAAVGLMVSQWLTLNPWLCMMVGAAVLGGLSVLFRNVLILILAVLVFSSLSGGGYLAVALDRAAPQASPEAQSEPNRPYHPFASMDRANRLAYMQEISDKSEAFETRLRALLANTWEAIRPHAWAVLLAALAGAVIGIVLVWFVARIVIALAYSIVGTTAVFIGAQATLLAAQYPAVSALDHYRRSLPIAFLIMIVIGWLWQLFSSHRRAKRKAPPAEPEEGPH